MKKLFLLICLIGTAGVFAQSIDKSKYSSPGEFSEQGKTSIDKKIEKPAPILPVTSMLKGTNNISPIPIGQSGNAWGFSYMRTTYLWADNDINSISFIHRMESNPGTGYLSYDLSTDGGINWSTNNQVYNASAPDASNARYPQGLIYNPEGNTDPNEAYFSYFAPTLDASNASSGGSWGGYAWGSSKLSSGSVPTQVNQASMGDFYQYLPSGYTVTQLGDTWVVDEEQDGASGEYVYTNNLIVGHGVWDESIEDFDYYFEHLPLEINPDNGINDVKVAFAPDGMTGWICALTDRIPALDQTWYHPVLFKTTDGGSTWSYDPIEVQFGGEDGLDAVKHFITDEALAAHYDPEPVPSRDEIPYFMGYHMDMSVDAWGNPHILGAIALCDIEEDTWYHSEGLFAMFHIYSTDQGETWEAFNIDNLTAFDMEVAGGGSTMKMYNRPQVATTPDGAIVFFSFLDTRVPGIEDNSAPDIFFREFFPETNTHGEEVINVTNPSTAMFSAYWGCMSHYVFTDVTPGGNYQCTIPFVYEELQGMDISEPVQFYYIPDFTKSYVVTGVENNINQPRFTASQNYPNPFNDETQIHVNLLEKRNIGINVYSITGQLLKSIDYGSLSNGPHKLTLELSELNSGVYFYSISDGQNKVIHKMVKE